MSGIKETIRQKYGEAARRAASGEAEPGCCGSACGCADPITGGLVLEGRNRRAAGSRGDGIARLRQSDRARSTCRPGQTVLDLGSGGGIDVLLSARRVGPTGKVYGLDMTDEMLALARENQRKAGVTNVEFLKGDIEHIPLPDASVDVDHLELRHQSLLGQAAGAARGVSRAAGPAGGSPSPTSWFAVRCPPRSAAASSCGWAASPARSRRTNTGPSSPPPGFQTCPSSPGASTASRTRATCW